MILVRFITERAVISDDIRFVTHAPTDAPSHVEFGLPDGSWLGAHIDGGVRVRPYAYTTPSWEMRYGLTYPPEVEAAIMRFVAAQIGKPYDTLGIAGILFNRDWHSRDHWFCSELVLAAFEAAGVYLLNVIPGRSYRIDPERLHLSTRLIGHGLSLIAPGPDGLLHYSTVSITGLPVPA